MKDEYEKILFQTKNKIEEQRIFANNYCTTKVFVNNVLIAEKIINYEGSTYKVYKGWDSL